jgi:hypothetical protein
MFSKSWSEVSGPYADRLNSMPKLVASTTLAEPPTWNAHLVKGDVARELKKIKEQAGPRHLLALSLRRLLTD